MDAITFMTKENNPSETVAQFISRRIAYLGKPQRTIAQECGFQRANMITLIKQGKTNLPFYKILPMAKALEVDPKMLLNMCYEEYRPDEKTMLEDILEQPILTEEELRLIEVLRTSRNSNLPLTDESFNELAAVIKELRSA